MTQIEPHWESIVEKHAERVFRIAYRILGSVHDAEDVSQNVFSEAYNRHRNGPVQSWTGLLVRMATLRAIDLFRTKKSQQIISSKDRVSSLQPSDDAVGRELAEWLRDTASNLPEQQAAVFSLTHYEQLDRNEIGAILNISPESVSTALYKARQNLQSQLNVFYGGTQS